MGYTGGTIAEVLGSVLDVGSENFAAEMSLEEAGVDSLAVVELAVYVEQEFGVVLEEHEIAAAETVSALDQLIVQKQLQGQSS